MLTVFDQKTLVSQIYSSLYEQLSSADIAIHSAWEILLRKGFPGMPDFMSEITKESCKFHEKLKKIRNDYLSSMEQIRTQEPDIGRQSFVETKYRNNFIALHLKQYKKIHVLFKEKIFNSFVEFTSTQSMREPAFVSLIAWLDYGLENLAGLQYDLLNEGVTYFSNATEEPPQGLSLWKRLMRYISSRTLSHFQVSDRAVGSLFDIQYYNELLIRYSNACSTNSMLFAEKLALPLSLTEEKMEETEAMEEEADKKVKSKQDNSSSSLKTVVQNAFPMELFKETLEVAKAKTKKDANSQAILIDSLFSEIKDFVKMIEKIQSSLSLQMIKDTIQTLSQKKEDHFFEYTALTAVNQLKSWLDNIKINFYHEKDLYLLEPLIHHYQKMIPIIQGTQTIISKTIHVKEIKKAASEYGMLTLFESMLSKTAILRVCYYNAFDCLRVGFESYQRLPGSVSGGSQKKALGTGFYIEENSENRYFIKRTTRLSFIADDISEVMASSMTRYFGSESFSHCKTVKNSNNTVYVASQVSNGFSPLFDMKGKMTTRLTSKKERQSLYDSLSETELDQTRNIIFLATVLGDTDPNPENLGKTQRGTIIKIDHGWAFDQLCLPHIITWHYRVINPLRYDGRIAPTNALYDYKYLFKKEYDISFLNNLVEKTEKQKELSAFVLDKLKNIIDSYAGTEALGSLQDSITEDDLLFSIRERLGLDDTYQTLDSIAEVMSQHIYFRVANLYLICSLENMSVAANITLEMADKLTLHVDYMLKNQIPFYNQDILSSLSTIIFKKDNLQEDVKDILLFSITKSVLLNIEHVLRPSETPLAVPVLEGSPPSDLIYNRKRKRHDDEMEPLPTPDKQWKGKEEEESHIKHQQR